MKDFVLAYNIKDKLYLNITNRCTNRCLFCIRNTEQGVGYNLWLEREPEVEEVLKSLVDLKTYSEVVFCGYGEPLIRMDLVQNVAEYIKREWALPVRVNTNGHADLIHGPGSVQKLRGLVDRINISLNAQNSEKYQEICQSAFGEESYDAVIRFAESCIGIIPDITLSVVEWPGLDLEKCRQVAERLGVSFQFRKRSGS